MFTRGPIFEKSILEVTDRWTDRIATLISCISVLLHDKNDGTYVISRRFAVNGIVTLILTLIVT